MLAWHLVVNMCICIPDNRFTNKAEAWCFQLQASLNFKIMSCSNMTSKRQCKLQKTRKHCICKHLNGNYLRWTIEFHYEGDLKVETGQNSRHLHLLHESLGMGRELINHALAYDEVVGRARETKLRQAAIVHCHWPFSAQAFNASWKLLVSAGISSHGRHAKE